MRGTLFTLLGFALGTYVAGRARARVVGSGVPPQRRWSLWLGDDDELRAASISPTWGGGGYVVVPEDPTATPPWEARRPRRTA